MSIIAQDDYAILSHEYNYLVADLRTNDIVAELPFNGCSYGFKLSQVGEFSASLQINSQTLKVNPDIVKKPGRYALYITRDGKVVWGGIIWGGSYSVASRTLSVNAESFFSYFFKIFNRTTKFWSNSDQLDIARWLIASSQIDEQIRMDVDGETSGVMRERIMFGYEFKTIGEEFEALANLIKGFDFDVRVYQDPENNEIKRKLELYYPQKGRLPNKSDLQFEFPGSIVEFEAQFDAKEAANIVYTIGAGTGSEMLWKDAKDNKQIEAGWPKLEISRSFTSVYKYSTLQAHADKILNLKRSPITVYSVQVRPDEDPPFGSYSVGDWANFKFNDPFLGEVDTWQRIVEISVDVDATGLERISLTLDAGQEPIEDETDVII